MMNQSIMTFNNVKKVAGERTVLSGVDLSIEKGRFYAFLGDDTASKSAVLDILSFSEPHTTGEYLYFQNDVTTLTMLHRSQIRHDEIAYINKSLGLLPHLSILENVLLPMYLDEHMRLKDMVAKAKVLLSVVALRGRENALPESLSQGERLRAALARALVNDPSILIVDEPEVAPDKSDTEQIFHLLKSFVEQGKTVVVSASDFGIEPYATDFYYMTAGKLDTITK